MEMNLIKDLYLPIDKGNRSKYISDWPLNKVCLTHSGGEVPDVKLETNKKGQTHVMLISDIHFGQKASNMPLLKKHLDLAKRLKAYIILMGDLFEVAIPSHIESSVFEVNYFTGDQYDHARKMFGPLKDRIIFSLSGNHDHRVWKKTGFDLAKRFAEDMGCFYNMHGGLSSLNVGKQNYLFGTWHGYSAGMNPFTELEKRARVYDQCDVIALGNNHALCAKVEPRKRYKNGKEVRDWIHLIRTGSYMTEPEYGRAALYPPTLDGSALVTLGGNDRTIEVDVRGELRWPT